MERLSGETGFSHGSLLTARGHYKGGARKFYIPIWPVALIALPPKNLVVQPL